MGKEHKPMPQRDEPTYRLSEIVGTSSESVHQAVRNGLKRASQTIRNLDWFEVSQIRGTVIDGEVGQFQVAMKVGFRVED
jgi:dodecin